MVDIKFWAASGSEHQLSKGPGGNFDSNGFEIVNLERGATNAINRIGFFGSTGPGSTIVVGQYQSKTYPTDNEGDLRGPPLVQLKFVSSAVVQISGLWNAAVGEVPSQSGTVAIRFTNPGGTEVTTQNARISAVRLTAGDFGIAGSGVEPDTQPDNLDVQAFECKHPFAPTTPIATTWTKIAGTSAAGGGSASNQLSLQNHSWSSIVHDYFVALSASPTASSVNKRFAFMAYIEYL